MTALFSLPVEKMLEERILETCSDASNVYFRDKNIPSMQFKVNFTTAPVIEYEPIDTWPSELEIWVTWPMNFTIFRMLIESRINCVCNKNMQSDLAFELQKLLESLTSSEKRDAEIVRFRGLKHV